MEQESDGSTHSHLIGDGTVMFSITSFMSFSNFINGNISKTKTNRTSGWDQGAWWHLRNQSHFDRTLDDT